MEPLLKLNGVSKQYDLHTPVLSGVDLDLQPGECISIAGPSGCGKSTLLNIIGSLDRPDKGSVVFEGTDLLSMNEKQAAAFRCQQVGFVFQLHHLLPQCTVLENVLVPSLVHPDRAGAETRARVLLDRAGLSGLLHRRPGQLSGGERQRTAVVRALINRPRLLLADEPTGALNPEGAESLFNLLLDLNQDEGLALIIVTHSLTLAERTGRVLHLREGTLS